MGPFIHPNFDPIIFSLGPLHVRWYGLMYILGFAATYFLVKSQIQEDRHRKLQEHFENINLVLILCVVLGGRLGYVLFYNFSYYVKHPLEIPATWSGGMSFHGACLGVIVGGWIFAKLKDLDFWESADIYVATIPIGLGLGRIGNFINGELYGRATDVPWGMVFSQGGPIPRHPSQLYEVFLEGVVLFCILWAVRKKPYSVPKRWPHGSILALFLILYGVFRSFVERFREPDEHIGLLFNVFSMGQLLSFAMIAAGLTLWSYRVVVTGRTESPS